MPNYTTEELLNRISNMIRYNNKNLEQSHIDLMNIKNVLENDSYSMRDKCFNKSNKYNFIDCSQIDDEQNSQKYTINDGMNLINPKIYESSTHNNQDFENYINEISLDSIEDQKSGSPVDSSFKSPKYSVQKSDVFESSKQPETRKNSVTSIPRPNPRLSIRSDKSIYSENNPKLIKDNLNSYMNSKQSAKRRSSVKSVPRTNSQLSIRTNKSRLSSVNSRIIKHQEPVEIDFTNKLTEKLSVIQSQDNYQSELNENFKFIQKSQDLNEKKSKSYNELLNDNVNGVLNLLTTETARSKLHETQASSWEQILKRPIKSTSIISSELVVTLDKALDELQLKLEQRIVDNFNKIDQ